MKPGLYAQMEERAKGKCECCGTPLELFGAEADHFWGRAKAKESLETVWLLSRDCHWQKTQNVMGRAYWLEAFLKHARRHGYTEQATKAGSALFYAKAKASLGEGA